MMLIEKIAIIGVGGIGGYFGGMLANSGLNVSFIARGETLKSLKKNGLKIESVNGNINLRYVKVTNDANTLGSQDLILICVKAHQITDIFDLIKPLIGEDTIILPLQNGIDAPSQLAREFGNHVIGGCCRILSEKIASGTIKHSGASIIEIGEINSPITNRILKTKQILESGGIKVIPYDDFRIAQWSKMMLVCSIGGITSVTRSTIGEILLISETSSLLFDSMNEINNLAKKLGINLKPNLPEIYFDGIKKLPTDTTTSLQRDIMTGKPSELHFQVGSVVKLGKELSVATPVNSYFYYSLLPLEMKARKNI